MRTNTRLHRYDHTNQHDSLRDAWRIRLWSACRAKCFSPSAEWLLVLLRLEVTVGADLLHQPVICAREGDEDAYDLERLGADPGGLGLGVFGVAGLARVVHAGLGLLRPVGSLVFHATVELRHLLGLLLLLVGRVGAGGLRRTKLGRQVWIQD